MAFLLTVERRQKMMRSTQLLCAYSKSEATASVSLSKGDKIQIVLFFVQIKETGCNASITERSRRWCVFVFSVTFGQSQASCFQSLC